MPSWETIEVRLRTRLARNVRRTRRARGLSIESAADEVMHWRQWQRVEAEENSVTLRTLAKLAAALGVDPVTLLQ